MELQDLIAATREVIDDTVNNPYLCSDIQLTRYLNNAIREVCIRTRQIQDDSSEVCSIPLVVDQVRYPIDSAIFVVRAVYIVGRSKPLTLCDSWHLDDVAPGWFHEVQTSGIPEYAIFDAAQNTIVLYPPPSVASTMKLRVWRSPIETELMEESGDDPALQLPDIEEIKHWAAYEVFNNKDGELYDPERSDRELSLFENRFGERPSTHAIKLWSQSRTRAARRVVDY